MPTYLIAQIEIVDRDEYAKYEAGFMDVFSKYRGEIVSVDEAARTLEGDWPYTRTVVIRFPDAGEADRWYNSPEYQQLVQHRFRAARTNAVLVNGFV